jgi:hypothetical protein
MAGGKDVWQDAVAGWQEKWARMWAKMGVGEFIGKKRANILFYCGLLII